MQGPNLLTVCPLCLGVMWIVDPHMSKHGTGGGGANWACCIMSQSIPTGYIPPGNPGENFFERANPGHPGKFFCLIPCPGAKNDGRIPGVGQNFPRLKETTP